jgi:hypothetical protein
MTVKTVCNRMMGWGLSVQKNIFMDLAQTTIAEDRIFASPTQNGNPARRSRSHEEGEGEAEVVRVDSKNHSLSSMQSKGQVENELRMPSHYVPLWSFDDCRAGRLG